MKKVDSKEMAQNFVAPTTRFTPKVCRPFINHSTSYIQGERDEFYKGTSIGSSPQYDKWQDANLSYRHIYKASQNN